MGMDASLENLPRSLEVYELALEGLARVNEWIYRHRKIPSILDKRSGVEYRRENGEHWRHVGDVIKDGWGDCEDLAAARVGELRAHGEGRARVVVRRTGPKMTHALVRRSNGKLEDPSRSLGMGRERVVTMRQLQNESVSGDPEEYDDVSGDWEAIGADVSQSRDVSWTIDRTPTGWKGVVRVPLDAGRALIVSRTSDQKGPAGKKAAGQSALNAAAGVLDSPLAKALIPPQAQMALNLVRNPALRNGVNAAIGKLRHLF